MAQTPEGAIRRAATVLGLTADEYRANVAAGLKYCGGCKAWHPATVAVFGVDSTRYDKLVPRCRVSRQGQHARTYVRRDRTSPPGPPRLAARAGDRKQARHSVNLLVRSGRLAAPNTLPCFDCGNVWKEGDSRHEYDHHLGYAAEHHLDVQAVCVSCHRARESAQRRTEKDHERKDDDPVDPRHF